MYKRMMHFINVKNILFSAQYGFREGFSTEHAIVDIVSAIQSNMDKRLFTCGIFIDLKKAFDTVNHQILLNKLNHYGFRGIINNWFESFLRDRSQTLEINKLISDTAPKSNGVPQGSILGPLLFSYILTICILAPILLISTSLLMILPYCMLTRI